MMKTTLITGQDGTYLSELLLKIGYIVHSLKPRSSLFNTDRIDHLYQNPHVENIDFSYITKNSRKKIINTHINIGNGKEVSIKEFAETIKEIVRFKGELLFNSEKYDGKMCKLIDSSKLKFLVWKYSVELREGIEKKYGRYITSI